MNSAVGEAESPCVASAPMKMYSYLKERRGMAFIGALEAFSIFKILG